MIAAPVDLRHLGVQIVAPQYGDCTSIHFARLLKREFQAFVPPLRFE